MFFTHEIEIQNFDNDIYCVLYTETLLYDKVTMHFLAWEFACGML